MIEHKIVLQVKTGQNWADAATFTVTNRYELNKEQRGKIAILKYEFDIEEIEYRVIKRKEVIK